MNRSLRAMLEANAFYVVLFVDPAEEFPDQLERPVSGIWPETGRFSGSGRSPIGYGQGL